MEVHRSDFMDEIHDTQSCDELVESSGPMSPVQQRLYLCDQLDPGNAAYNLPPLAIRIAGQLRIDVLEA